MLLISRYINISSMLSLLKKIDKFIQNIVQSQDSVYGGGGVIIILFYIWGYTLGSLDNILSKGILTIQG